MTEAVTALVIDASGAIRSAMALPPVLDKVTGATERVIQATNAASEAAPKLARELLDVDKKLERVRLSADPAYKALRDLEKAESFYSSAIARGKTTKEEADRFLGLLETKARKALDSIHGLSAGFAGLSAGFAGLSSDMMKAAQAAGQSQINIAALTGQRDLAPLAAEVQRDYEAFWSGMLDKQDAATAAVAGKSQDAIRALTGQRDLAPLAAEVQRDYEAMWASLLDKQDAAVASTRRANEDLRASFDPLYAAQLRYERQIEAINDALSRNVIDEKTAIAARQRAKDQMEAGATSGITGFKSVGQAAQQAGYQVQDFFIQVAGGQNVLVAFAQQGSQMLGFFGAGGAMAGAALSIGAVVVNMLLLGDATKKAAKAVEEAQSAYDGYNKALELTNKLTGEGAALARRRADELKALSLAEAQKAIEMADLLVKRAESQNRMAASINGNYAAGAIGPDALIGKGIAALLTTAPDELEKLKGKATDARLALADLKVELDPVAQLALSLEESFKDQRGSGKRPDWLDIELPFIGSKESASPISEQVSALRSMVDAAQMAAPGMLALAAAQGQTVEQQAAAARTARLYTEALKAYGADVAAAVLAGKPLPEDLAKLNAELERADFAKRAGELRALADGFALESDAQLRSAAAAGLGEAATRKATAANAIAAATARSAAEGLLEQQRQARLETATVENLSNTRIRGLQEQTAANDRMTAALKAGGTAVAEAEREEYRLAVAREVGADAVDKISAAMAEYDRWKKSELDKGLADEVGRQTAEWERQNKVLTDRNALLARQVKGGLDGLRAGAQLVQFDVQTRIDDQVLERERELQELQKKGYAVNIEAEKDKLRKTLEYQASLEKQLETQRLAGSAADALGNTLLRLGTGDMASVVEGVGDFMTKFKALQTQTGSAADAFSALGEELLNSAEAGAALGNMLGDLLGRSDAQNKNAQIGSTVATTVGDFFGLPKGLTSFVGNVIGGLFGPGKSDSTAGVQISPSTDRIVNFDTKPEKQSSENMSARDALADSVNKFTNLLTELTGGRLADAIAIEVGSRDGNKWRVYGVNGQMTESGVTAVGDIEGTLSQVLAAVTRTLEGVSDELKAKLTGIDFSNLERAESDVNFVLAYDTAIGKLNGTLRGGDEAVAQAKQNVVDMRNEVTTFSATAARLGYDTGKTTAALKAYVEQFAGISDALPEMTDVEIQVAALKASFAELAPLLEQVGYNAADAAAAVAKAEASKMAALRADVQGTLDRRYNDLIGNSFVNAIGDALKQRDEDLRDALAVGLSGDLADRNFRATLGGILTTDLRTDQLKEAIRLFGTLPGVTETANGALAALAAQVKDTGDAAQQTARSAEDIARERYSLETQLLQAQGDTLALRARELAALDPSNVALQKQIYALQDQKTATEKASAAQEELTRSMEQAAAAAKKEADVTHSLEDRVGALTDYGKADASIRALLRRQQAEFRAAVEAGYTADQLRVLADVLGGEMTQAVDQLNQATIKLSEDLQKRLLSAMASDPLLNASQVGALQAQVRQIDRNRELADATSEAERSMLKAIYAAEDQARANQAVADAAAAAAKQAEEAAAALDRIQGMGGTIRAWIDQMRGGGLESYLSPQEVLSNTTADFAKQLGLAQLGDETALGGIKDYAERLIKAQQAVSGSGGATRALTDQILAQLAALPAVKSFDQKQLELLGEIAGNTKMLISDIVVGIEEDIRRTVSIVNVSGNLTADQKALALLTSGEATRLINIIVQAGITEDEKRLALSATGQVVRTIQVLASTSALTESDRSLALQSTDSVTKTIGVAVNSGALTADQRALALAGSEQVVRTIQIVANTGTLSAAERTLALQTSSTAARTINVAVNSTDLTADQRTLALRGTDQVQRTIQIVGSDAGLTADQRTLALRGSDIVQRIIAMGVDDAKLTAGQRSLLLDQASSFGRTLRLTLDSDSLSSAARDLLLGASTSFARVLDLTANTAGLTDAQRGLLLDSTGRIARIVELGATQPQGLTADQKKLLDAEGGIVQRTIAQAIQGAALTSDQKLALEAVSTQVDRVIKQTVTVNGSVLQPENLSASIAIALGDIEFQGQSIANRYLAAIAWNTARVIGVGGQGLLITDDVATPGDQTVFEGRSAAQLNAGAATVDFSGVNTRLDSILSVMQDARTRLGNLHAWLADVWAVQSSLLDKIKHNTAETSKRLGGGYSYAAGTDNHPGGLAFVHADELLIPNAPAGMKVLPAKETAELMLPRSGARGATAIVADMRDMVAAVRELKAQQLEIARAQAGQHSMQSREQVRATKEIAQALKTRTPVME